MLPVWDMLVNGMVNIDLPMVILFSIIMILNFIISMLSYPVAARIAMRVFIQTIKHKKLLQITEKWDDDFGIYQGYYRHYMIILGLLCALIVFSTFNSIASINGIYLLINFYSIKDLTYKSPEIDTILKIPNTRLHLSRATLHYEMLPTPVSQYGLYTIQAIRAASQEAVFTLGAVLSYQIIVYLKDQKFPAKRILTLLIFRIMFVFVLHFNIPLLILNAALKNYKQISYVNKFYAPFPFALKFWETFENIIRCMVGFYFMRETLRAAQLKKERLVEDAQQIQKLGFSYNIRVERTIKMFKIYAIMYFILTCVLLSTTLFESHLIFLFSTTNKNFNEQEFKILQTCVGMIVGVLGILPITMYIAFLVAILKYIGRRGITFIDDNSAIGQKKKEDFDALMENFFGKRAKIEFFSTVSVGVLLALISAVLVGYLLIIKWYVLISLKPGDYININETSKSFQNLKNSCDNLMYSYTYTPKSMLDHKYSQYVHWSRGLNQSYCENNVIFYNTLYPMQSIQPQRVTLINSTIVYMWLPNNTRFYNFSSNVQSITCQGKPMPYACYIDCLNVYDPAIGGSLCNFDTHCGKFNTFNTTNCTDDQKTNKCNLNFTGLCGLSTYSSSSIPNTIQSFSVNRTIVRGTGTNITLHDSMNSQNSMKDFNLILHEPNEYRIVGSKENEMVCKFHAVCYYSLYKLLLLGGGTFLLWCIIFFSAIVCLRRNKI